MVDFTKIITAIIVAVVSGLATWLTKSGTSLISAKITEKKVNTTNNIVDKLVLQVVEELMQTIVLDKKATQTFDDAAKKLVLDMAISNILSQLSEKVRKFIEKNYGDIGQYLTTKIEATILEIKERW